MPDEDRTVYLEVKLQKLQALQEAWARGDQHDTISLLGQLLQADEEKFNAPVHRFEQCQFERAYNGLCSKPVLSITATYCPEHEGKLCISCAVQATRECCFANQFVCGQPLCNDCSHTESGGHSAKRYTLKEAAEILGVQR